MQVTMPSDVETNVVNDVAATPVRCSGLIDIEQRLQNGELGGSSNWEDIENKPATFPPSTHSHDDLYYTESEVNNLLNGKLDSNGNASNVVSTFTQAINFENLTSGESLSVSLGKIMKAIEVIDSKADKIAVYSEDASQIVKEIDLGFKMLEEEGNVTKGQLIDRDTMGALYPETTWERIIDKPIMNDYYTKTELDSELSEAYYNKSETDSKLNTKANVSHTHTVSNISDFPTSIKNPNSMTVQLNGGSTEGTNKFTYDGSTAKSINVTPSAIGAYTKSEVDDLIENIDIPTITIDSALSSTSTNPVQNKVINTALSGKANSSHTHTKSQIIDFPTSLKNPSALTISLNGTSQGAYDGSAAKSINITASSIGAAAISHSHSYLPLSGGTLSGKLTANGKINIPTTGGTWLSGATAGNPSIWISTQQTSGSYHPILGVKSSGGHTVNFGGLGDQVGFYGYKSGRTANGTDWHFYFNASTGAVNATSSITASGGFVGSLSGNASTATKLANANVTRMYASTMVITVSNRTYATMFTSSTVNSYLGVSNSSASNTAVFVSNGDDAACGAHFDSANLNGSTWYLNMSAAHNGGLRVNFLIVYWW